MVEPPCLPGRGSGRIVQVRVYLTPSSTTPGRGPFPGEEREDLAEDRMEVRLDPRCETPPGSGQGLFAPGGRRRPAQGDPVPPAAQAVAPDPESVTAPALFDTD